jgi:uncharacterized Zn finger protein
LDEKPDLFFTLRGIDINKFVASVAKEESRKLLVKADAQSDRVLSTEESDTDLGELFGISFDNSSSETSVVVAKTVDNKKATKRTDKQKKVESVKKVVKKTPAPVKKKTTAKLNEVPVKNAVPKRTETKAGKTTGKAPVNKAVKKVVKKKVTKKKVSD